MEKSITVGVVPAPELPEEIAYKLIDGLTEAFSENIDDDVDWKAHVYPDPLTGAAENVDQLIERAEAIKEPNEWDYVVCLTDLPIFSKRGVVLADVNDKQGVAQISVPSFGFPPMKNRIKLAIIQVVGELYYRVNGKDIGSNKDTSNENLLRRRFLYSPVRKITPPDGIEKSDVRFILRPRLYGRLKLLLGMTHANKPWSIIPSFRNVMAIAFATGSYGLIFPTLWRLSAAYEWPRFIIMTTAAVSAMIIWITIAHNLWEKPSEKSHRKLRLLYNTTTVMTLAIAIGVYYFLLFIMFLLAVAFIVPPDIYGQLVGLESGEVSIRHFFQLGWLATSVATVAGAIGSGLESDEKVRNIMYGYRQQQRYEQMDYYGKDESEDK
ncbi:hypothetical protein SAMN05216238_103145 [Lentibacillus persicus]|uniref:5,10-methylene-tetrahydrofolate dehydrogenase n=1 Tax=Lentibacillus persicus TaxID=640948 RepID=A0A1I1UC91_9BACI|nr:hypothetical protein [Lentibacillus persicus]SFD68491.1 hypothetical protein SAMN05216238_103145 [Lentibacillus persicus]